MALDVLVTTNRLASDPHGRQLVDYLRNEADRLSLGSSTLYYDFPVFSDYETVAHKPDCLLATRGSGIFAIRILGSSANAAKLSATTLNPMITAADESLTQFCSILIGRLLKSRPLRQSLSSLRFPVTPVIFLLDQRANQTDEITSEIITSLSQIDRLISSRGAVPLEEEAWAEVRSVIEGAKALTKAQKRVIEDPIHQGPAAALAKLEAEIANFDQKQRRAALVSVPGPQRIRGLAGSGKTVILAMKAAHLHLTRPGEKILITFYTRSLRASIKNLITRFYRHYRDEDPDWDQIHIRHGWGGARSVGAYADAARRAGISPLPLSDAKLAAAAKRTDPFDYVCRELLATTRVEEFYDHVLIDEGQDFPSGFYELCYSLTKGPRDQKQIVWAYDELQNILNVKIRTPEELFGVDRDGECRISLERTAALLPPGATNDTVLSKCYRNQREVLVVAHALGFGIYGPSIVQLLESPDHWRDVGYEVLENQEFQVGRRVKIVRPPENSPVSLDATQAGQIIECHAASSAQEEINWVVEGIERFLTAGLHPEDIIVIALDDRNAKDYLKAISRQLAAKKIPSNNIIADPYSEPPFTIAGMVTLSTVYRAKGNEAAVVFAMGVDAVPLPTRSGRNRLFTAFTRSKAWLRVSGVGRAASAVCDEIDSALAKFPELEFVMPDLTRVELGLGPIKLLAWARCHDSQLPKGSANDSRPFLADGRPVCEDCAAPPH